MTMPVFEREETFTSFDEHFYHSVALRLYDRAIPRMLKLLNVRPNDLILDAGCGVGVHSVRAVRYGRRVHAIDISSVALAEARRRAIAAGVQDAIIFAQGDLTQLELQDESFAAIFSWGVLIHIPEVERALDELVRLLKPGGRLALYVTNSPAWDDRVRAVGRTLLGRPSKEHPRLRMGSGSWYDMHGEKLWVWQFDVKALTAYLESCGLRRICRIAGEFTQLHVHAQGRLRNVLFHVNDAWSQLRLPAWLATTNLPIFEKPRHNTAPASSRTLSR